LATWYSINCEKIIQRADPNRLVVKKTFLEKNREGFLYPILKELYFFTLLHANIVPMRIETAFYWLKYKNKKVLMLYYKQEINGKLTMSNRSAYPKQYGEPLTETKGIRLTKKQLEIINAAGSTAYWREWMIAKAREELGIPVKAGSADQWGGSNEETD
jgi:hypothetical protein